MVNFRGQNIFNGLQRVPFRPKIQDVNPADSRKKLFHCNELADSSASWERGRSHFLVLWGRRLGPLAAAVNHQGLKHNRRGNHLFTIAPALFPLSACDAVPPRPVLLPSKFAPACLQRQQDRIRKRMRWGKREHSSSPLAGEGWGEGFSTCCESKILERLGARPRARRMPLLRHGFCGHRWSGRGEICRCADVSSRRN